MPIHMCICLKMHEFVVCRLRGVELWILTRIWNEYVHGRPTGRSSKHGYTVIPWPMSPRLRSFRTSSFVPRHSLSSQARKFFCTMLKMSLNWWTPMFRSSRSAIFSKSRSQVQVKSLWKLSLSLRSVPWQFRSCLRGLDSLKSVIKVSGWHWFERATNNQLLEKELWGCLPAVRRFWRRRCGLFFAKFH